MVILAAGCSREPQTGVMSGTAHIKGIVTDLTGAGQKMRALIPPGMCPGHYDMAPADIAAVANCEILLLQPWQMDLPNVQEVIRASGIEPARIQVIDVPGNWMVPSLQAEGTRAVAAALAEAGAADPAQVEAAAQARAEAIETEAQELLAGFQERVAPSGTAVVVNVMQQPFAEWLGFRIAGAFGRGEDMSAQEVDRWVRTAREERAALVIENLQSGDAQTSRTIARDAGLPHVIITNFPGGFEEDASYVDALRENLTRIEEALHDADGAR